MPRQTKARTESGAGKRYPLNMRTTKALREKLEKAAAAAGRSLAQEVELRLEHSFLEMELMVSSLDLAYGSRLAGVLLMLGEGMKGSSQVCLAFDQVSRFSLNEGFSPSPDWIDMPFTFDQAARCANTLLEALRPPGEIEIPERLGVSGSAGAPAYPRIWEIMALHIAQEALSGDAVDPTLHRLLGPTAGRLRQLYSETESQK